MFRSRENEDNVYKIETDKKIDIKRLFIIIGLIFIVIILISISKYAINSIKIYNEYKQYQLQLEILKKEEDDRQAKIAAEEEEKRQAKIPKLTQVRKRKYGKYISFRNKKSIFNI